MTLIQYINELTFNGTLDKLYMAGIVPYHYIMYRDIYNMRDALLRQGYKKTESVYTLSVQFGLDYSTIYRALKEMNKEI